MSWRMESHGCRQISSDDIKALGASRVLRPWRLLRPSNGSGAVFLVASVAPFEHLYVKEWIDYHLALGVQGIYLFPVWSVGAQTEERIVRALVRSHENETRVSLVCMRSGWPGRCNAADALPYLTREDQQNVIASHVIPRHLGDWVSLLDIDEFLTVTDARRTLMDVMSEFTSNGAASILVTWQIYGPGHVVENPTHATLSMFTVPARWQCHWNWHYKTLYRASSMRPRSPNVNAHTLFDEASNPDLFAADGTNISRCHATGRCTLVDWRLKAPDNGVCAVCLQYSHGAQYIRVAGRPRHPKLLLRHYMTRSRREWALKMRFYRKNLVDRLAKWYWDPEATYESFAPHNAALSKREDNGCGPSRTNWTYETWHQDYRFATGALEAKIQSAAKHEQHALDLGLAVSPRKKFQMG